MQNEICGYIGDGNINLIIGPMFSGKSSELLRMMRRYSIAKKNIIVIKYHLDNRYADDKTSPEKCSFVSTHDFVKHDDAIICNDTLMNVAHMVEKYDVIGIDEGQFFVDIKHFCERMANMGKIVVVAALDGDSNRKPFGSICDMVPLCESVVKLKAICQSCYKEASFTKKYVSSVAEDTKMETKNDDQKSTSVVSVEIGGSEMYMAVCRACFIHF